jgi:hypothetical protein
MKSIAQIYTKELIFTWLIGLALIAIDFMYFSLFRADHFTFY